MITHRPAAERLHTEIDWLDSWHTFSFGHHHDPRWMGFRALRVINDDVIAPRRGFGTHGHRDMEILTYVLSGTLTHKDSMGTGSTIHPGEVQRMSAGTGVMHSEENPQDVPLHLLQIWILPARPGVKPGYAQVDYSAELDRLRLVASPDGRDGSIHIHQDARMYAARPRAGTRVSLPLDVGRYAWVHLARGKATLEGAPMVGGDGAGLVAETSVELDFTEDGEVLIFDLP